ncbi:PR domain zinc finger protein 5-like [Folsomia candida]|uniref:PR domain zinc finger protein 5-like n=1 Tax=Folsomia candida TaxID=158441 RepID=UPI000B8F0E76|nr:PR domain zinc finger protein 5-like [Folsomia candida]
MDSNSENKWKCTQCSSTFKCKTIFDRHILNKHNPNGKVECKICGKIFKNPPSLSVHVSQMHTNRIRLSCDICNNTFSNRANLQMHIDTIHNLERTRFQGGFPGCDKTYLKQKSMLNHEQRIHIKDDLETLKCQLCQHTFARKDTLTKHIRVVHENQRNYPCTFCDKRFSQSEELKAHVEAKHVTNKELIHSCDKCDYKSYSKRYLAQHVKRHNARTNFVGRNSSSLPN